MEMAVLKSNDIEHGPIECVFTRDEETGLGGAIGMKSDFMNGDYLINLDSEDEGEIFVSCAGGANTVAEFPFDVTPIPAGYYTCKVMVKGLMGGHSGDDINKNRANANKQLVRFLCQELKKTDLRLVDIQTGGLHNAIPREGYAIVAVPNDFKDEMRADLNIFGEALKEEFSETEKNIQVLLETEENAKEAQEPAQAQRQLSTFLAVFNGVFAMSQTIPGFVETSSNLASIHRVGNKVDVVTSQRSSIMSNRAVLRRSSPAMAIRVGTPTPTARWCRKPLRPISNSSRKNLSCVVFTQVWSAVFSARNILIWIWSALVLRCAACTVLMSVC